jgi:hypothetical protein
MQVLDSVPFGEPRDPRCTATPPPPVIPLFVVVVSLDLISASLFTFSALDYFRRIAQLLRSIGGLLFFLLIHTYARENTITSPTVGQEASVQVATYIVLFSGIILQAVEATAVFLGLTLV